SASTDLSHLSLHDALPIYPKGRKVGGRNVKSWEGYVLSDAETVTELPPEVTEESQVWLPQNTRSEHESNRVTEVTEISKSPRGTDLVHGAVSGENEVENSVTSVTTPFEPVLTRENMVTEASVTSLTPWTPQPLAFTFSREEETE